MSDLDVTKPKPKAAKAGDYLLVRKLGVGAFGTVFEARHIETDLPYAVKRLQLTEEDAERFRKEALYPARIASQSLHVLGVYSFFRDEKEGYFYLVTELVPHGDLRSFLDRHPKPMPVAQALELALGVARGLAAIHEQGIVHRDLKPGNILMDRKDGRWVPKIADFGLARSAGSISIGEFASPGYAAPEQLDLASDLSPGTDSDLFALGMILYELLTGSKPTAETGLREYSHWLRARRAPVPPSHVRPELAAFPALDTLIGDLLEFDRTRRPSSAAAIVPTLSRVLRDAEQDRPRAHVATPVPGPPPARPVASAADEPRSQAPSVGWRSLRDWGRWSALRLPALGFAATAAPLGTGLITGDMLAPGSIGTLPAAFFGLLLGRLLLGGWMGAVLVAVAGVVVYNAVLFQGHYLLSRVPGGILSVYLISGCLGALLMTLLLMPRRPEFRHALVRAAIAGTIGGAGFIALLGASSFLGGLTTPLMFAGWQVLVGCTLVDYGARRAAANAVHVSTRPAAYVAVAALAMTASGFGVSTWRDRQASIPAGEVEVNPRDNVNYRWVPPGDFRMGCSDEDNDCHADEMPNHTVTVSRGFWLGETEVTVDAWRRVMSDMPPDFEWAGGNPNPGWTDGTLPIVNVTWDEAEAYCVAIGGRLPTESQWEYAARAGSTSARYGRLDEIAWYADVSGENRIDAARLTQDAYAERLGANRNRMRRVGQRAANVWGLSDMLGNVSEWVRDDYADQAYKEYYAATDPEHRTGVAGTPKVLRGGSWYQPDGAARVSFRGFAARESRGGNMGFRCVWDKPE